MNAEFCHRFGDKLANRLSCLSAFLVMATAAHAETREITAGPEYDRSGLHNIWWGENYRELWTTPIDVEVLDLEKEAGGLTPEFEVGGKQTPGLALKGADGRSYTFRSVNKDHRDMLPIEWRQTIVATQVQDQVSATHPGVFPVVNGLAEALPWVIQTPQRMIVMPDDPRLGEYRERFAGLLGTFGEFPTPVGDRHSGFRGATEILSSRELWDRWLADPKNRINAELFLRYRIVDIWTGNWDRHAAQWRWAMVPGEKGWQPIAEDPDQAFADYGGAVLWLVRWHHPLLLSFKDKISGMEGVAFNGASVDRWLLTELDRSSFVEAAREVQARLTDEVIDNAVKRLPAQWFEINGRALAQRLKERRNNLLEGIDRYYLHLADQVSIHATDRNEMVHIRRFGDGAVEVSLALQEQDAAPYYRRRFEPKETKALHIYLYGGDDRVVSEGPPVDRITVHVVGGSGNDTLDDSASGRSRFYDFEGQNDVVMGEGTKLDARPYENPVPIARQPWLEPRDFGKWTRPDALLYWTPDLGALLGLGFTRTSWSFRKYPFDNNHSVMANFSTGRSTGALGYTGSFRSVNSKWSLGAKVRYSGIDSLNFFGFGNETEKIDELDDEDFYEVDENLFLFSPTADWRLSEHVKVYVGPELQYTDETSSSTLIDAARIYGGGGFGQIGLILGLDWNSRGLRLPAAALVRFDSPETGAAVREYRTGVEASIEGSYFPPIWDVDEDFGALEGELVGILALGERGRLELAGRLGGRTVSGRFPWREAAFIGGQASNRGFSSQRFAGDNSLYGSFELRMHLLDAVILFPGRLWLFALTDVGRVWSDGGDSDEWHPSYGGGFVVELPATPMKIRAELVTNDDEDELKFYFATGFAF